MNKEYLNPGTPVFMNPVHKILSPEQQKFEKIEKMAWDIFQKIYIAALTNNQAGSKEQLQIIRRSAWCRAEEFYDYAKQEKRP